MLPQNSSGSIINDYSGHRKMEKKRRQTKEEVGKQERTGMNLVSTRRAAENKTS